MLMHKIGEELIWTGGRRHQHISPSYSTKKCINSIVTFASVDNLGQKILAYT